MNQRTLLDASLWWQFVSVGAGDDGSLATPASIFAFARAAIKLCNFLVSAHNASNC